MSHPPPRKFVLVQFVVLLFAFLALTACQWLAGPAAAPAAKEAVAPAAPATEAAPAESDAATEAATEAAAAAAEEMPLLSATEAPLAPAGNDAAANAPVPQGGQKRMIIKNGELRLLVADTDAAMDRAIQIAADAGGYILSSKTWFDTRNSGSDKYAALTLSVPADQFEAVLSGLRGVAVKVLDENATGQDVTAEFVDLGSRLDNLRATRDRIRTFLDEAKTVEEALKVNEQLSEVEAQIDETQGRINYLKGRAAYSTINLTLEPELPPTPTPTPTSTPMPTPTATSWNPGATFERATTSLRSVSQGLAEALIWLGVVVLPFVVIIGLVVWLVWYLFRRRRTTPKG